MLKSHRINIGFGSNATNPILITPFRSLCPLSMSKTPGSETNIFGQTPQKPILMITFKSLSPRARGGDLGGRQIPPPPESELRFSIEGETPKFSKIFGHGAFGAAKVPLFRPFSASIGGGAKSIPPERDWGRVVAPPPELRLCPLPFRVKAKSGSPHIGKKCDKKAIFATPLAPQKIRKIPFFRKFSLPNNFAILASMDLDQTSQNLF